MGLGAALAAVLLAAGTATAQTSLRGQVVDQTTRVPLSGVQVELRRGASAVATSTSDGEGRWQLTADLGTGAQVQNLKLVLSRSPYVEVSKDVTVASGAASTPVVDVSLQRQAVADCLTRLARPRRVVVAHFLPPLQGPATAAFADRVAHALRQELLFLETARLAGALQHSVVPCAQLDDADNLGALARELKADALMGGQIAGAAGGPRFNVTMTLRDAHGLFDQLAPIRNPAVDLEDPSAARLAPATVASVALAIVTGHAKERRFAECVQLGNLALAALLAAPPATRDALAAARTDCQRQVPAAGLTRGAG
jgi:hypothetical protein